MQVGDGTVAVVTPPEALETVKQALEGQSARVVNAELTMNPKTTVALNGAEAEQALRLLDRLDDLDDVQRVYTNAEFPEES